MTITYKLIFFIFFSFLFIKLKKKLKKKEYFKIVPLLPVNVPSKEIWSDVNTGQCTLPGNNFINYSKKIILVN